MKRIILSSVLVLSMMGATPGIAGDPPEQSKGEGLYKNQRFSLLLNRKVVDAQGESLGRIKEVLVNQKGEIQHLVIGARGFWGIGRSEFQVPWTSLRPQGLKEGYEMVLPQSQLTQGPETDGPDEAEVKLWKLSSLIGLTAGTRDKPSYGEIDELLFDPETGRVTYFVVERNGWVADRYAVPWADESILGSMRDDVLLFPFSEAEIQSPGVQVLPATDSAQFGQVMNLWL